MILDVSSKKLSSLFPLSSFTLSEIILLRGFMMTQENYEIKKQKSLEYYYNHREEVLKKQTERWKKKYREDSDFREKRQFRDKSRIGKKNLKEKECVKCKTKEDLQRHHLDYKDHKNIIIVCRKCHNQLHKKEKVTL